MEYKIAVICKYQKDYITYLRYFNLDPQKHVHVKNWRDCSGKYFGGLVKWYKYAEVEDIRDIESYIEYNTKRTLQQCFDYLDEKQKVLDWLIIGQGRHGWRIKALEWMSKEFIVMNYNVEPEYFK